MPLKEQVEKKAASVVKRAVLASLWPYIAGAIVFIMIFLFIMFIIVATFAALCNPETLTGRLVKAGLSFTGVIPQGFCEAFGSLSSVVSYVDRGTVIQPPAGGGNIRTWEPYIRQAAAANGLPFCFLQSILQQESAGNPQAIGHDHTAPPPPFKRWAKASDGKKASGSNAHDPFDPGSPPRYNLDWIFSHGIGLKKITIFPQNSDWVNSLIPARRIQATGKKYTVLDLLDPASNINAAAELAAILLKENNGDFQAAAGAYNGSGRDGNYALQTIDLTNKCSVQT